MSEKFYIRNVIGEHMNELGKNERVCIVNADLSATCRNSDFVKNFPNRSFNVGIAEQNAVSFATGLAHEGFLPYVFSMAPFLSMRACEAVRTDVAYANLPIRLIAPYAGVSGGISGATHWGIEDIGIMTSIPNIIVVEPSCPVLAKKILNETLTSDKIFYIRNSVCATEQIYNDSFEFKLGRGNELLSGKDGAFICCGIMVSYALKAAKIIKEKTSKEIMVVDMHTIKPIDEAIVLKAAKTGVVVTAEDHNVYGGLGSMVARILALNSCAVKFKILGINDKFETMAHAEFLHAKFEYDTNGLVKHMLQLLGENP